MIKGFRQIAVITALSRVFGLIRDVCYCYFFGASTLLDAWFIAFKVPNLSRRLFGEGAASASFIPTYSHELFNNPRQAAQLVNTVLTVLAVLLSGLVLIGWGAIGAYYKFFALNSETRLVLSLTSLMLPYMLFICLVALLAGILNVHRHFATPAVAPIVLNIFIIITVVVTGGLFKIEPREQLFAVAIAVLVAGVAQLVIQIPPLRSSGVSFRPAWQVRSDAFKKIIIMMGPMMLGLTATQLNTLADDVIAWLLSGSAEKGEMFMLFGNVMRYPLSRGCVSHLNIAQRLYQMPLGVFGISLATAIFPVMSSDTARKDMGAFCRTISKGLRGAIFIAIPSTVGLILIAGPLVSAVFRHGKFTSEDAKAASIILLFYSLGLTGFFIQQIVTRAFYSMHDSKAPMYSAITAVFVNIILNLTLIWFMGTAGLALSTAICSYLQVGILLFILRRRLGVQIFEQFSGTMVKTLVGSVCVLVSGSIILWFMRNLPVNFWFNIIRLIAVVPPAAGVYLLVARLLRIRILSLLTGGVQKGDEITINAD